MERDQDLAWDDNFDGEDPVCPECDLPFKVETGCIACINREIADTESLFNLDNDGRW